MSDPGPPSTESEADLDPETQRSVVWERYARIAPQTGTDDDECCSSDGCCADTGTSETPADATAQNPAIRRPSSTASPARRISGSAVATRGHSRHSRPERPCSILGRVSGSTPSSQHGKAGEAGHVIGIDMTPEMVEKARENARTNESETVEFRLGEIEHLPVADETMDVIISNCVVNLSPDKPQVFQEAYRALRPGGRLAISDVVQTAEIPADLRADPRSVPSCVAGASTIEWLEQMLTDAGFEAIDVMPKDDSDRCISEWDDERDLSEFLVSANITGQKPPISPTEEE